MIVSAYILELKKSVMSANVNQAKALLDRMAAQPPDVQGEIIHILALAPDKTALMLLDYLTGLEMDQADVKERLIQLLTDRAHLNFEFILILFRYAGRDRLDHLAPLIRHVLNNETRPGILAAAIETVGREKIDRLIDDVAEFIYYDDAALKAKAVRALERIGSAHARRRLEEAAATEKCDQDILDAVAFLSAGDQPPDTPALVPVPDGPVDIRTADLVADLKAPDLTRRFKAFRTLQALGEDALDILQPCLGSDDPDLVSNCMGIFSRTLPLKAVNRIIAVLEKKGIGSLVKFAVYELLGSFPELDSAAPLVRGINEPSQAVRMAAVRALDRNLTDFVKVELRNRIESGTKSAAQLAHSILDAKAVRVMEYLLGSDTFSYMASNHLSKDTAIEVLEAYTAVLETRGLKSTVKKFRNLIHRQLETDRPAVVIVSPLDTVLNLYAATVSAAGCRPLVFKNPQDAFESVLESQPILLLTDLFLADLTGIDFAGEIRELYDRQTLPVIVSTRQAQLVKHLARDRQTLETVNAVYEFPVRPSQLKTWLGS